MARRQRAEEEGVSLFPFLSIIACVIGVLTLLIAALALAQMGGNEDVANLEQFENLQRELKAIQEEIERLKKQLDAEAIRKAEAMGEKERELAAARQQLEELLERIVKLRQLLAQLVQTLDAAGAGGAKPKPGAKGVIDELAGLKGRIDQLKKEMTSQKEQIAQLEKDLEERKKPPVESEVSVLPGGSGLGFEPIFVECAAGSILIHEGAKPQRVRTAELAGNQTFLKLLAKVSTSKKQEVVFLIRGDGLSTYHTARRMADSSDAKNGKLPVIGKGRLNLGYFTKKSG